MASAYDQHLSALHAGFETPDALIRQAARAVTASPVAAKARIVHGEANEVYALSFENGLQVIVRIARRAPGLFEKERWAIDRCRALGVAAPEVLSIQRLEDGAETLEVCILERLPGQRLSDSLAMPRETLRGVVCELGDHLSRMHSITADDLGEGAHFFADDTDDFLAIEPEFVDMGARAGLPRAALQGAIRLVAATFAAAATLPRCLTHNDLRACHVMVHDGRLSGMIDFGQVSIDSPVNEFGKWAYWEEPDLPVAWLEEGYDDKSLFGLGYADLFAAHRVANALWVLRWYSMTGYAEGVQRAAGRLAQYFGELGF